MTASMIFRVAGLTAVLVLGAAAPAAAVNPERWSWGSIYSADRAGKAKGTVTLDRPGFVVSGRLYDFPTEKGCSWLRFRWVKEDSSRGSRSFRNCAGTKPLKFSFGTGYMLSIEGKVCRGDARRITGRCSPWEGVWAQGG